MKKFLGITRSRTSQFELSKISKEQRKNRFKIVPNDQESEISEKNQQTEHLTSSTQNSIGQDQEITKTVDIYEEAKESLKEVSEYKRKIVEVCKLRITAFKESEAKKYDIKISDLSKKAIESLLIAEKSLKSIRSLKGENISEEKYYRNMEKSLALEIREQSKELRLQEKEHFDRLKSYEKGTANMAIELSETQKERMKSDIEFEDESSMSVLQEQDENEKNKQLTELVQTINQLGQIYRTLNELIIEQGTLIDRIDFNIEETFVQIQEGNKHLVGAEKKAGRAYAEKCIAVLVLLIFGLAIVLIAK